ncbi:uncharacterized protein LOC122169504 [Centrocercus urophasianus]|uniref:uncharacterized protein LOC122169504 n=1 Tax=Centrocercus urophasianus TaxID=9002 RepID=UPI001C647E3E|nr:uncharacterized protein LOC122169504 [Centrocercus urophasianus]XP_042691669.1 uncharacterized protein LOC122169504 [Centrocercus urophasianus]XP_042691670.1 uncharacterized protein LOC122169504 [Centrocercus urophasianus]
MFGSSGGSRAVVLPSAVTTAWRCVGLHGNSKELESASLGMPRNLALLAGNCLPSRWQQSCVAPEHFKDSTEVRGSSGSCKEPESAFPGMPGTPLCWPVIVCPAGKGDAHPPVFTHYLARHKVGFPELISALHGALDAACPFLSVFSLPPAFHCSVLLALGFPCYVLLPSCFGVPCGILLAICSWPPSLRFLWPSALAICATFPWPLSLAFFATFTFPPVLAFPTALFWPSVLAFVAAFSLAVALGLLCPIPFGLLFWRSLRRSLWLLFWRSLPCSFWPLLLAFFATFPLASCLGISYSILFAFGFGLLCRILFGHCP